MGGNDTPLDTAKGGAGVGGQFIALGRENPETRFEWQEGYFACSVSRSQLPSVVRYTRSPRPNVFNNLRTVGHRLSRVALSFQSLANSLAKSCRVAHRGSASGGRSPLLNEGDFRVFDFPASQGAKIQCLTNSHNRGAPEENAIASINSTRTPEIFTSGVAVSLRSIKRAIAIHLNLVAQPTQTGIVIPRVIRGPEFFLALCDPRRFPGSAQPGCYGRAGTKETSFQSAFCHAQRSGGFGRRQSVKHAQAERHA